MDKIDISDIEPKKNIYQAKGIPLEGLIEARQKGLSMPQIAKLYGCTTQTVHQRLKGLDLPGLKHFKKHKADVLAHKQRQILEAITPKKIDKAPLNVLGPAFGILYDKERLERGQATQNVSFKGTLTEVNDTLKAAMQSLRELEGGREPEEGGEGG